MMNREEIEKDARLCAHAGDESGCAYPDGSAEHAIWTEAYKAGRDLIDLEDQLIYEAYQ